MAKSMTPMRVTPIAAFALATAIALAGTPALSAPVPASMTALKQAVSDVTPVYYRGRGWAGAGVGFAAGAIIGSALASPRYYDGYGYVPPYTYGPPYYYQPRAYYGVPVYRGYPACDQVDSSGVASFDNC